jgi:hypothetical protein
MVSPNAFDVTKTRVTRNCVTHCAFDRGEVAQHAANVGLCVGTSAKPLQKYIQYAE